MRKAYDRSNIDEEVGFREFVRKNAFWLEDYALFMALKDFFGGKCWNEWPEDIKLRYGYAIEHYRNKLYFDIEFQKFLQYKFDCQWKDLKYYANSQGIQIVFTREGETADRYIQELAARIGGSYSVRVATSDSLVQLSALGSGVLRLSARELLEEVRRAAEEMRNYYST